MDRGTKGSNGKGQLTQSPPMAYIGTVTAIPNTTASYARSSDAQGYRQVAKMKDEDKQTGSYQRYTAKEEVTTGEKYRGRGHKEYGVKDKYKTSSTLKVGNPSGYTEYYKEERVRNVSYGGANGGKNIEYGGANNNNSNAVATNNNNNNYSYGGGYDSSSDSDNDNYSYGGGYDYYSDSD